MFIVGTALCICKAWLQSQNLKPQILILRVFSDFSQKHGTIKLHIHDNTSTAAPLPAPINLVATPMTTSITLTWEQPEGANAVDSYDINYSILIEECVREGVGSLPPVEVSVDNSTLRSYMYTLSNSSSTPVEEYSLFRVSLTAVNSVTRSVPSQFAIVTTTEAGINSFVLLVIVTRSYEVSPSISPWISTIAQCQFYECH